MSAKTERTLRIEYRGQIYDWVNLDEVYDALRSPCFVTLLRDNISHYFGVPLPYQALYDEDGLLSSAVDFSRAFQSIHPFLHVYDTREMSPAHRESTIRKLGEMNAEIEKTSRSLRSPPSSGRAVQGSGPVRSADQPDVEESPGVRSRIEAGGQMELRRGDVEAHFLQESSCAVRVMLAKVSSEQGQQRHGPRLSWGDVISSLAAEGEHGISLRQLLSDVLRSMPFAAFFWECSPVSLSTMSSRPFEFVVVDAPALASVVADDKPFLKYIQEFSGQETLRSFFNATGDALLLAPAQASEDPNTYAHIARFFRGSSAKHQDELWRRLGETLRARLQEVGEHTTVWVSTDGRGVNWLHLRVDLSPKYYKWQAYMDPGFGLNTNKIIDESEGWPGSNGKTRQNAQNTLRLYFDALHMDINQEKFLRELLESFHVLGVPEATLRQICVTLHPGSVVVLVTGPTEAIDELRTKPLETIRVMGYAVSLFPGSSRRIPFANDQLHDGDNSILRYNPAVHSRTYRTGAMNRSVSPVTRRVISTTVNPMPHMGPVLAQTQTSASRPYTPPRYAPALVGHGAQFPSTPPNAHLTRPVTPTRSLQAPVGLSLGSHASRSRSVSPAPRQLAPSASTPMSMSRPLVQQSMDYWPSVSPASTLVSVSPATRGRDVMWR